MDSQRAILLSDVHVSWRLTVDIIMEGRCTPSINDDVLFQRRFGVRRNHSSVECSTVTEINNGRRRVLGVQ